MLVSITLFCSTIVYSWSQNIQTKSHYLYKLVNIYQHIYLLLMIVQIRYCVCALIQVRRLIIAIPSWLTKWHYDFDDTGDMS